jgi:hypothetical protein
VSLAWKGFHSFSPSFKPSFTTSLTSGVSPVAAAVFTGSTYATNLAALSSVATFSRAGNAMQFDSSGYLTYAPNNLLTQSNTFSNAVWAKNNGGTGVAPIITANAGTDPVGGNAASRIQFSRTNNTQADYSLISHGGYGTSANNISGVWLKSNTGSSQNVVLYDGYRLIGRVITVTTSWQLFSQSTLGSASSNSNITFGTYGGTGNFYNGGDATIDVLAYAAFASAVTYETSPRTADQVITTASAYYGPRIDYDPNTLAVKGLLIEEARTNLAINSASLSSFSPFSMTATTNFAVAPDGTSAATKLDDGTTAAVPHQVAYSPSGLSASTAYAFSVFAKQGTGRYLALSNVGSASADGGYAVFDLQAGTVTQSAALGAGSLTSATITPINGGWYRLSVVTVAGTNTARFLFVLGSNSGTYTADSNGRNSYTGTNNTWLVWGAQLELGSFATSYIPTGASSVTRAADVVQFTGPALTALQGASGTAIVEYMARSTTQSGAGRIIGTTSPPALLYGYSDTVVASWNGSRSLNATIGSSGKFSTIARTGVSWSAAGTSLVGNGGTVATDANTAFGGVTPVTAYLASESGSTNFENGWYRSFAIYTSRLPDATLQARSVVGASY